MSGGRFKSADLFLIPYERYKANKKKGKLWITKKLTQTKPDLILLDLMLPGLSGEKALLQIKGIPVIVVSAKVDVDDKVQLLRGGAADYITKPFQIKELLWVLT